MIQYAKYKDTWHPIKDTYTYDGETKYLLDQVWIHERHISEIKEAEPFTEIA